ncbi:MAG: cytidylate kinase family protein [Candidatus Zixiibacteriota bacterium]|nr:MAG: cytidylate kinase family protein [candidate division Zixibacteria bacterium]
MSVITISRGTFTGGQELASHLAKKLGYQYMSREDLSEQAIKLGVPVGKLQTSMVKPPRVYRRLGRERDQYLACITMILCEKILEGDIVYLGHTGHMLLPGIPNILRIRVLADSEFRINSVIQRLNLNREKAKEYIRDVDADRDKWVKFLYGIDWYDPFNYDLVINLDQTGTENAATALCAMAELPDFKLSPASVKAINNLYLSGKTHFALLTDPRTSFADVKVTANNGVVQVTYLPQQAEVAPYVKEVLSKVSGVKEIHTTIAQSNVLFIQDKFSPGLEILNSVIKVAKKWDAAVELMSMTSSAAPSAPEDSSPGDYRRAQHEIVTSGEENGGIEDDTAADVKIDEELSKCLDELRKRGCSGGSSNFYGDAENLLSTLQRRTNYSMVVIGDIYTNKGTATKTRLKAEMKNLLSDNLNIPIVETSELEEQFKFGYKQVFKLLITFALALAFFLAVFTYQREILIFLSGEKFHHLRILAVLFVLIITPLFAYNYGSSMRQILRLFRLD